MVRRRVRRGRQGRPAGGDRLFNATAVAVSLDGRTKRLAQSLGGCMTPDDAIIYVVDLVSWTNLSSKS
jgi:hypothetical protein